MSVYSFSKCQYNVFFSLHEFIPRDLAKDGEALNGVN